MKSPPLSFFLIKLVVQAHQLVGTISLEGLEPNVDSAKFQVIDLKKKH